MRKCMKYIVTHLGFQLNNCLVFSKVLITVSLALLKCLVLFDLKKPNFKTIICFNTGFNQTLYTLFWLMFHNFVLAFISTLIYWLRIVGPISAGADRVPSLFVHMCFNPIKQKRLLNGLIYNKIQFYNL